MLSSAAPDLAMLDELFRSFRAASSRGERVSLNLHCKAGRFQLDYKPSAAAGPPADARPPRLQRAAADPAARHLRPQPAAAGPTPTCASPSPASGRRRGPRRRGPGALLRDERRRHLRISPDVLARSGRGGRCPPATVYRPALPDPPAPVRYKVLTDGVSERLLLLVPPPAAPPQPSFRASQPISLHLRTRAGGGLALSQLDGDGLGPLAKCMDCDSKVFKFELKKSGWSMECGCMVWCTNCYPLLPPYNPD